MDLTFLWAVGESSVNKYSGSVPGNTNTQTLTWFVTGSVTRIPLFVIRKGIGELFTHDAPHCILNLCLNNWRNSLWTI